MSVTLRTLLVKLLFWFALEVGLNLVGLDNLADYSEFILSQADRNWQNHKCAYVIDIIWK